MQRRSNDVRKDNAFWELGNKFVRESQNFKSTMTHIYPQEAEKKLNQPDVIFLDVRTRGEYVHRRIAQAINIPLDELLLRHSELDAEKEIIVLCEHGIRSQSASGLLIQLGFMQVVNMIGGMSRWTGETVSG
jgi:Rhodanese-related sulfurtransferase